MTNRCASFFPEDLRSELWLGQARIARRTAAQYVGTGPTSSLVRVTTSSDCLGLHNVTCHPTKVKVLCLNPSQAGRYSICLPRTGSRELALVVGYIPRWFTCPQTVSHPSSIHLIAVQLGVELTTS